MPKLDDETLKKRYEKAKDAWSERQKANRARQRREKALEDARRETLIGKMLLSHAQENQSHRDRLMSQLDAFLEDDKDRSLFDLSPKSSAPDSTAKEDLPTLVYTPRK